MVCSVSVHGLQNLQHVSVFNKTLDTMSYQFAQLSAHKSTYNSDPLGGGTQVMFHTGKGRGFPPEKLTRTLTYNFFVRNGNFRRHFHVLKCQVSDTLSYHQMPISLYTGRIATVGNAHPAILKHSPRYTETLTPLY